MLGQTQHVASCGSYKVVVALRPTGPKSSFARGVYKADAEAVAERNERFFHGVPSNGTRRNKTVRLLEGGLLFNISALGNPWTQQKMVLNTGIPVAESCIISFSIFAE